MQLLTSTVCCIYSRQDKLLFSSAHKIKEINLDTGIVKELVNLSATVFSISYDVKGRYVYASTYNKNEIVRFPYPNDEIALFEIVVSTTYPYSIAFDSVNRHLYWTEAISSGKIMRCNSDGSHVTTIVPAYNPLALTLDTHNRWIYYSEGNALHRVTFDGIEKHIVVNLTAKPIGIEIDYVEKRVYWMEYDTGDLKSALYNGSDVETVISTNVSSSNREIVIDGDYIFCTSYKKILKIHKSSGYISGVVHRETSNIYGLLFYKPEGKTYH